MTEIAKLVQHGITAEWVDDEHGPGVMLTQSEDIERPSVFAHPWQLRAICQHLGIIESTDPEGARTIAALQRRMLTLRERVKRLASELEGTASHPHAQATADIATEFCQDFAPTEQLQQGQLELIG